jgi:hypothetical protein
LMLTINGINMVGVTWGIKCSNMWLVFSIHPNNINLIHKVWAKVSVRRNWKNTREDMQLLTIFFISLKRGQ